MIVWTLRDRNSGAGDLKPVLHPVNDLRPLALVRVTENPARKILGFDDKYACLGYQDMINLGCAVCGWERDVVEQNMSRT